MNIATNVLLWLSMMLNCINPPNLPYCVAYESWRPYIFDRNL